MIEGSLSFNKYRLLVLGVHLLVKGISICMPFFFFSPPCLSPGQTFSAQFTDQMSGGETILAPLKAPFFSNL